MLKYLFRIPGFFLAFILTVLFFELYFQTSEISVPSIIQNDSNLGRSFRPEARINLVKESLYIGKINALGYLGPEYSIFKNPNTIRVALIGDSFIEGLQVKEKFHFRSVLESKLRSKSNNKNIEVLNFGRSGLDFRRMYILHELYVKEFKPDIVLFFVNESDFTTYDERIGPELIMDENKNLIIDKRFAESEEFDRKIKYSSLRSFSIYNLFQSAYTNYIAGETSNILFGKLPIPAIGGDDNNELEEKHDKLFRLNSAVLNNLSKEKSGTQIIIVSIASNKANRLTEDYTELIKEYGIEILFLDEVYNELENKGVDPFFWAATNQRGHWNYEAHNAIGKFLSKNLLIKLASVQ